MTLKHCIVFAILCISISLVSLATPRFIAALNHIPVDTGIDVLKNKRTLAPAELDKLINITQQSLLMHDSHKYWSDLSFLQLTKLRQQNQYNQNISMLRENKKSITESLIRSPAESFMWFNMATVLMQMQEPVDISRQTLIMSILTGANEPGFIVERLQMCFLIFSSFDLQEQKLIKSQILIAWNIAKNQFINTILPIAHNRFYLTELLAKSDIVILDEMKEAFEKTI